ncbi:hypothetical protein C8Q80DRAFT_1147354 [Daedaleopsis nitida]|nr:hypothetical protein C8Q80DRAFT_1147354 [Daedaleopsis nitida]
MRPDKDGLTAAFTLARELAVGARRDEVRFLRLDCALSVETFASALLEVDDARVFVLARLRRVPIDETAVEPVILDRVPIDETALVRVVWREAVVPALLPFVLLTRERAVPTVVVDLTVPEGAVKGGIGERARALVDFVDVTVPIDFASDGFGLTSLLEVEEVDGTRRCPLEPDTFLVLSAAGFDAASALTFSVFLSAALFDGTGILDEGAALPLLPAPIFHTLRTRDLAEERKPNRDALPFAAGAILGRPMLGLPRLLRRRAFKASSSRFAASCSFCFFSSSAGASGGASDTLWPLCTSQPSVILIRLLDLRAPASSSSRSSSSSSALSSSASPSPPNPPGTTIFFRVPALMTLAPAVLLRLFCPATGRDPPATPSASDLRLFGRRAA